MSEDARFEDGAESALKLRAEDAEDLKVISTLIQDAIIPASEITYDAAARRFGMLLNRFRWERKTNPPERVQAVLVCEGVTRVQSDGVPQGDADSVLSLLTLEWVEGDAPAGHVIMTLAGDGAFKVEMECLEVILKDVTLPYTAPSRKTPDHPLD